MRWRTSGVNWEGRQWRTAPSLNVLMSEHDAQFPQGNSSLDGTVASRNHDKNNPNSDHRPTPYTGVGVVRAYDWWFPNLDTGEAIFDAIRNTRDKRIAYIIFNRQIVSSTNQPWVVRPYTGSNPHDRHGHLSVLAAYDGDTTPWNVWTTLEPVLKLGDTGNAVARYQQGLVNQNLLEKSDGIFGPQTEAAVAAYQRNANLPVTGQIDGITGALLLEWVPDRATLTVADVKGLIAQSRIDPK